MKQRVRDLASAGEKLFSARQNLTSLWQTIADNFYVERADFTTTRTMGVEFASHLMTAFPSIVRRDLANQFAAMFRPRGEQWFHIKTEDEDLNELQPVKVALERLTRIQYRAMYDRRSGFVRAMHEGDHDVAAFGQAVLQPSVNRDMDGLLYRLWHLRDVAWAENDHLEVDRVHRKQKLDARCLVKYFGKYGTVSPRVTEIVDKEPFREFNIQHIVVPARDYDLAKEKNQRRLPFVSIYIDSDNDMIMEETPSKRLGYVIRRWQTVSGSQYARSPAAEIALPDARLIQQMTLTILEAAEKSVDPPSIAVEEAINGGVNLMARGISYISADYDERTGPALRPYPLDRSGIEWGEKQVEHVHEMLMQAFYLNQIRLPEITSGMTAYEMHQRVEEYIRQNAPLFEPMEDDNGRICEDTFDILMDMGAFGNLAAAMPKELQGQEVKFVFDSPLQQARGRAKTQAFLESMQVMGAAVQYDQGAVHDFDMRKGKNDAIEGTGAPAEWILPDEEAQNGRDAAAQEAAQQKAAQDAAQGIGLAGAGAQAAGNAASSLGAINQAVAGL